MQRAIHSLVEILLVKVARLKVLKASHLLRALKWHSYWEVLRKARCESKALWWRAITTNVCIWILVGRLATCSLYCSLRGGRRSFSDIY